jgi:Family of unknown function (DUF5677)
MNTSKHDLLLPELAESVINYINAFEKTMNDLELYPRRNIYSDIVALALLRKAVANAKAVCQLVGASFFDDAYALSRTSGEIALILRYLTNTDIQKRSERYVHFFGKDRERLVYLLDKYHENPNREYSEDHEKLLRFAREFKTPHQWIENGKVLRDIAFEESTWNRLDNGEPETAGYMYEVPYRLMSHHVHATCIGVHNELVQLTERSNLLAPFKMDCQRNASHGPDALFTVWLHLHYSALCAFHGMNMTPPETIEKIFQETRRRFGNIEDKR